MTVGNTKNENIHVASGVGPYAFEFKAQDDGQVYVYLQSGTSDPLIQSSSTYTVTLNSSGVGGSITFTTAPDSGVNVIIHRTPDYLQNTAIPLGALDERALEVALDKLTIMCQDLKQRLDRSVQAPFGTPSSFNGNLPTPTARAGRALGFDGSGALTTYLVGDILNTLITATGSTTARTLEDRASDYANVLDYGALPYSDGSSTAGNSTTAFAAALATGKVVLVPAVLGEKTVYDIGDLLIPDNAAIVGGVGPSYNITITSNIILRRQSGATCILDVSGTRGALISGLCLDGVDKGTHGIYAASADANHLLIRDCSIRFCNYGVGGSDGTYVRSSQIMDSKIVNGVRGLINLIDSTAQGSVIASHTSHGVYLTAGCNMNYLIGNRIEFNQGHGINIEGASDINIVGNQIDRSYRAGIYLNAAVASVRNISIVGNMLKRNGRDATFGEDCHIAFDGSSTDVVITGNVTAYGGDDGTGTAPSPLRVITFVSGTPTNIIMADNDFNGFGSSVTSGTTSGVWILKNNTNIIDRPRAFGSTSTVATGTAQTISLNLPAMGSTESRSMLIGVQGTRNATTTTYAALYQVDMARNSGTPSLRQTEVTDPTSTFAITPNRLAYDGQTGNFTAGQVVTGTTSGATATIDSDADSGTSGTLTISSVSGTFEDNEAITDPLGGAAVVNGVAYNASGTLCQITTNSDGSTLSVYLVNATGNNVVYSAGIKDY